MGKAILVAIAASMLSINLNAGPSDHREHHRQEAHLHGLAEITLALEADRIELNLESPAANIVGFEHRASTSEQRRSINKARVTLESAEQLFSFIGTRCEITVLEIDLSAVLGTEESGHEENAHEHHHDQPNHGKSADETHSEISANYQFQCEQDSSLTAIALNFFEHFPGIKTLKAVWVTDSNQGSAELTAKSKTIYLRAMP